MNSVTRLATSKKAQLGFLPLPAVVAITELVTAVDPGLQNTLVVVTAALSGIAMLVQGALDWRHGSRSDKTGEFAEE